MAQLKNVLLIAPCRMAATPAFNRAAQLAKGLNATLRIVAFVPVDGVEKPGAGSASRDAARSPLWAFQSWLNAEAGLLNKGGLQVSAEVLWCQRTVANFCSCIEDAEADYVIKDMELDLCAQGPTLSALDWQLLHESPVPVLLVKHHGDTPAPRIVAAVDTLHCEPQVREMNRGLIESGYLLARSFGASLHLLSVYDRHAVPVSQGDGLHPASMLSYKQARQRFDTLADQCAIAAQHRHFLVREASEKISIYISRCGFDALVFSTNDYLSGDLLLGRTEQCVLGDPPCSILTFKSRSRGDYALTNEATGSFLAARVH